VDSLQIVVLALVQGLTEILPISSSAHLALVPHIFNWPDQGLSFDVALHIGTAIAIIAYFRADLARMTTAWFGSIAQRKLDTDSRLMWGVLLGTIPAGLAGLLIADFVETELRSPRFIACTLIGFALLLWLADVRGARKREVASIGIRDAIIIGIAQAIALMPGVSRSGITMTAGLALGLTRQAAARFSFLLSLPIVLLAGTLRMAQLAVSPEPAHWPTLILASALSGIITFLCIHFFLKFLARAGMLPFVIYRLILGVGLIVYFG
jgi:undecaprenyl-diphosphatase